MPLLLRCNSFSLPGIPDMCIAIFLALTALFVIYSDYVIGQYALAVVEPQQGTMVVAVGWELILWLWPVFVVAMLLASAVTVWIMRRCRKCAKSH